MSDPGIEVEWDLRAERDQLQQQLAEMTKQRDEARDSVQPSVDLAVIAATEAVTKHRDELEEKLSAIKRTRVEQLEEDAASHDGRIAIVQRDLLASRAMSKKLAEALVELARDMPACEHESVPLVCRYCQTRAALADYSKEQA